MHDFISEHTFYNNILNKKYSFIITYFNLDYTHSNKIDCILPVAIKYNYLKSVKLLLSEGADPTYNDFSALHECLRTEHYEIFLELIKNKKLENILNENNLKTLTKNEEFINIFKKRQNLKDF